MSAREHAAGVALMGRAYASVVTTSVRLRADGCATASLALKASVGNATAKCTGVASDSATLSYAGTLFYLLACATHAVAAAVPSPPPGFVFAGSRELTDTALNSTANADLPLAKRAASGEDALWGCAERTACPLNSQARPSPNNRERPGEQC